MSNCDSVVGVPYAPEDAFLTGRSLAWNLYETGDGRYLAVGARDVRTWANLCRAIGKEQWTTRLHDQSTWERMRNELKTLFKERTRDEWWQFFQDKATAVVPVLNLDEVRTDPQVQQRQMLVELDVPNDGKAVHYGIAMKLYGTPGQSCGTTATVVRAGSSTSACWMGWFPSARLGEWEAGEVRDLRPSGGLHQTKDGKYVALAAGEPWTWANLVNTLGRPEFGDIGSINADRDKVREVVAFLADAFKTRTRDQWIAIFEDRDTEVAPVYAPEEVADDPQMRLRHQQVELTTVDERRSVQYGVPMHFSETPGAVRSSAPRPGQDTAEVLRQLGVSLAK